MSGLNDDFQLVIARLTKQLRDQKETYLLEFFGSYEVAEQYGKYFVFEEYPDEFSPVDFLQDTNDYTHTITQRFRIRMKTKEELEAEGLAEISWPIVTTNPLSKGAHHG